MAQEQDGWISQFRSLVESAALRLDAVSDAQASIPLASDKWTAKETIGHLIDSAANNHQRFVRGQDIDHLDFVGYDQTRWVAIQHYNDASWHQLVNLWKFYNLHIAHIMAEAPIETIVKERATHSLDQIAFKRITKDETTTLEYLMRDYVAHLENHLEQIFSRIPV